MTCKNCSRLGDLVERMIVILERMQESSGGYILPPNLAGEDRERIMEELRRMNAPVARAEVYTRDEEREYREYVLGIINALMNAVNANKGRRGMGIFFSDEEYRRRFLS